MDIKKKTLRVLNNCTPVLDLGKDCMESYLDRVSMFSTYWHGFIHELDCIFCNKTLNFNLNKLIIVKHGWSVVVVVGPNRAEPF